MRTASQYENRKEEEGEFRTHMMTDAFFRSSKIGGGDLTQCFSMRHNFLEKRKLTALRGRFLHGFIIVEQGSVQCLVLGRKR